MRALRSGAVSVGFALALVTSGFSDAQEPKASVKKEMQRTESGPQVTTEQAIRAALAKVPGRVHELDVVHKKGKLIWEIEVITDAGRHMVVEIDGVTGAVLHTEEKSLEKLAGDPIKGKVVFENHCLSCHGADGKGSGPMGPLLTPPAADYTSDSTKSKSDAELLHTIQEGRPGTAMRSFKIWLSKQQMRDVLAYVRQLSRGEKQ